MNNQTYDFLKWFVWLFMPALTTLVGVLGQTLQWGNTDTIITIMTAVTTFLGAITGLSNKQYNKK
ncbi:MAG: phage holin [Aerococcus sp.]|nr:phage holin [Aerococcus sp.]